MTFLPSAARASRLFLFALAAALSACTSVSLRPAAPVENRSSGTAARAAAPVVISAPVSAPPAAPEAPKLPPGAENAGKVGYYTVRPGDTLIRVGLETGQNWRDLQRWNNLDNADRIEVGQVLRVVAPGVDPGATAARPVNSPRVDAKPIDGRPVAAASAAGSAASPPVAAPIAPPFAPTGSAAANVADDDLNWIWPAQGPVVVNFDDTRNKGLSISGKAGDPVLASADGKVVYAGSGLRGYGNLVILKHNETFLTAYAHNQALLVREDQAVKRGQKIAEMGSSDADRVMLHFEIRRRGKPIDPVRLLPPR